MKKNKSELIRINQMICNDYTMMSDGFINILKHDLMMVLGDFFDIEDENISLTLSKKSNSLLLELKASVLSIKKFKTLKQ